MCVCNRRERELVLQSVVPERVKVCVCGRAVLTH